MDKEQERTLRALKTGSRAKAHIVNENQRRNHRRRTAEQVRQSQQIGYREEFDFHCRGENLIFQ